MSVARSGRFAGERHPAFVRLNSSLTLDWRLWREDIEGSVAHAHGLAAAGVLTGEELAAIADGLAGVAAEIEAGEFMPRDEDEDVHMAVERRLIELIGDAGAKLHTGRSRNDQVVTDVRLHLRRVIDRQDAALVGLQELLVERAGEHVEHVLPAYTHLQRAQVTSLAHHLLAYFWMLARDRRRLAAARAACQELPLGSGAAVGLNYQIDRGAVAAALGFDRVAPNSLDAVADRASARHLSAARAGRSPAVYGELGGRGRAPVGFLPAAKRVPWRTKHHAAERSDRESFDCPHPAEARTALLGAPRIAAAYNTDWRGKALVRRVDARRVFRRYGMLPLSICPSAWAAPRRLIPMADTWCRGLPFARPSPHRTLVRHCLDGGWACSTSR